MKIDFPPKAINRISAISNRANEMIAAEVGTTVGLAVAAVTLGWVLELIEAEKVSASPDYEGEGNEVIDHGSLKAKIEERLKDPLLKDVTITEEEM